eukprot:CAMPEP_0177593274 /NCGR_PEP_ID=MMETSP0419_2-20121207/9050_1 /TAXON_ID=582737 /ORGANISM="Tetraselmis sp., Strain GSL018" /LENGTH=630 /DNA_ID=CAMNT_0019084285 /DNA_START=653 /DNA_END=2545 /DNA_ORIENTATION=-
MQAVETHRSCPGKYGWLSLVTLVLQGCLHSLVLRYSRTLPGLRYLASVAVIFTELLKISVCLSVLLFGCWRNGKNRDELLRSVASKGRDLFINSLPMAVPAALYIMQQMLVIVAATHLDVVTFQICSQMKVFPTAIFASALLKQHLSLMQWLSLPVLAGGVSLVTGTGASVANPGNESDWVVGVMACLLSGVSSAFAGVYFEKFVKGMETSSLWIRNCQLSMYGLPLGVVSLFVTDRQAWLRDGLFQGFNQWAWGSVVLQAFGGIVVGMVVKYADNILKNFANALSVICTVLLAIPIFGQYPSPWSILGLALTFTSIFMYSNSGGPVLPVDCCMAARGKGPRSPVLPWAKGEDGLSADDASHLFALGRYLGAGSLFIAKVTGGLATARRGAVGGIGAQLLAPSHPSSLLHARSPAAPLIRDQACCSSHFSRSPHLSDELVQVYPKPHKLPLPLSPPLSVLSLLRKFWKGRGGSRACGPLGIAMRDGDLRAIGRRKDLRAGAFASARPPPVMPLHPCMLTLCGGGDWGGCAVLTGALGAAQGSVGKARGGAQCGQLFLRGLRYFLVIAAMGALVLLGVAGTRFSMRGTLHTGYVLWGRAVHGAASRYAQEWGLGGRHPWRARIVLGEGAGA